MAVGLAKDGSPRLAHGLASAGQLRRGDAGVELGVGTRGDVQAGYGLEPELVLAFHRRGEELLPQVLIEGLDQ